MTIRVALDEDYHVHSTFSDGASTLAQNVRVAREPRCERCFWQRAVAVLR